MSHQTPLKPENTLPQQHTDYRIIMKFFIDTAEISEIRDLAMTGMVDGVTTNPTLIAKSGRSVHEVLKDIQALVPGPISAEVTALEHLAQMKEADVLRSIGSNIAIKVPITPDGLKTCKEIIKDGGMVNVTLVFSAAQALLAAKAGATFVSPFVGRVDDIAGTGMDLISDIITIFARYPTLKTEILVASVRGPLHVIQAARLGAHIATLPPAVLRQMYKHPLTDKGIETFANDWAKSGQTIL